MKYFPLLALSLIITLVTPAARAQDNAWVQIEALRTLAEAQTRARAYSGAFPNVSGFRTSSGWYAVALGPYTRTGATTELRALKRERLIPSDSYLAFSNQYRQQFWPVGANTLTAAPGEPQSGSLTGGQGAADVSGTVQEPARLIQIPDESPREARASERNLDPGGKRQLQEALQWEGFYDAAIDGSFGQGTRRAMAAWQAAKGHEATGILTTKQRADLVESYLGAFSDLGLKRIRDKRAGIDLIIPQGKVRFGRTEAPFVQYNATDDDNVRVLLISQSGDEATLFGLYDIMQTLEIVPPQGHRERKRTNFVLTGQSDTHHSYTYARLTDGAIKGFTLIWKPENDKVMQRVVGIMVDSFSPVAGIVLPDTALSDDGSTQRIDLLAGLELRRPERSRTGFYVDTSGSVLTTTDLLGNCNRLTIGEDVEMRVQSTDEALGLALLEPQTALTPIAVAQFRTSVPRLNSEVAVAGFPYEDALDLPVVTYGTLADIRGLQGEETLDRLKMSTLPGDAGGPVFDRSGAVMGMLHPAREQGGKVLPPDVSFSADVTAIERFLSTVGKVPAASAQHAAIAPEDLATLASDMAVRVSCWN